MNLISLFDFEARARLCLPHNVWDFIEAGAMDELTTRRNRTAFEALTLRPRLLRDVSERRLSTTVLGTEISLPVMIAPASDHMNAHPDGELATARGAGMSDTLMILSTASNYSMEEVAENSSCPLWFHLFHAGYDLTKTLVERAEASGYKAIVLTVDAPIPSPKERDIRNRYQRMFPLGNLRDHLPAEPRADAQPRWELSSARPLTWMDLPWLRSLTSLPVVLKGIRTAEDAHIAVESGIDGIFVSTQGGRLLDMTMSSIEALPEVVEAVNGRAEVYLDSGVRRGSDVLKALALGARAVAIGRALFWGLAVNGADGVHSILEILREELDRCLAYCGQTSVQNLETNLVGVPVGWGEIRMTRRQRDTDQQIV